MRKITFEVPVELISDFTEKLTELGLENSITGKTGEDEIEIEVLYDKEESSEVDELEEYLEELKENLREEETEEENEEEEDHDN